MQKKKNRFVSRLARRKHQRYLRFWTKLAVFKKKKNPPPRGHRFCQSGRRSDRPQQKKTKQNPLRSGFGLRPGTRTLRSCGACETTPKRQTPFRDSVLCFSKFSQVICNQCRKLPYASVGPAAGATFNTHR